MQRLINTLKMYVCNLLQSSGDFLCNLIDRYLSPLSSVPREKDRDPSWGSIVYQILFSLAEKVRRSRFGYQLLFISTKNLMLLRNR
jgi:hypothetical protein